MMTRLIYSRPQLNEPLNCWDEVIGADFPDVGSEGRLRLLGVVELLDCLGHPVFLLVKGFTEGLKVVLCSATLLFRSTVHPA